MDTYISLFPYTLSFCSCQKYCVSSKYEIKAHSGNPLQLAQGYQSMGHDPVPGGLRPWLFHRPLPPFDFKSEPFWRHRRSFFQVAPSQQLTLQWASESSKATSEFWKAISSLLWKLEVAFKGCWKGNIVRVTGLAQPKKGLCLGPPLASPAAVHQTRWVIAQ